MKDLPARKNIRLKGYDYSKAGYYFVTMCVKDRSALFGRIVGTTLAAHCIRWPGGQHAAPGRPFVELTALGMCVDETIQIAQRRGNVDQYVVMPNHVHLIVVLPSGSDIPAADDSYRGRPGAVVPTIRPGTAVPTIRPGGRPNESSGRRGVSLQQVVRNIKSFVTKQAGFPLWQSRFYDHVIRNEAEYRRVWAYIDENPARWQEDCYFTGHD